MSLTLRLLSISSIVALGLSAASEKDIVKFVKRGLESNQDLKVYDVRVVQKQPLEILDGWETFIVEFKIGVKRGGKEHNVTERDILFAKDRWVSPDLVDVKTNRSFKSKIVLNLDESFYDDRHLIFGNKNAKHKLVVFSDPLCPFCREVVPKLFEVARKYPDTFALYYYHLPIESLHPASVPLAKAIIYLKEHGKRDLIEKIYKTDFDYAQTDEKKVLEELNKKLGLDLTVKQINEPQIVQELEEDQKKARELMVRGTPTLYVDGKVDRRREAYKKFIPKSEK